MALKSSEESADLALPEVSLATKKFLGFKRPRIQGRATGLIAFPGSSGPEPLTEMLQRNLLRAFLDLGDLWKCWMFINYQSPSSAAGVAQSERSAQHGSRDESTQRSPTHFHPELSPCSSITAAEENNHPTMSVSSTIASWRIIAITGYFNLDDWVTLKYGYGTVIQIVAVLERRRIPVVPGAGDGHLRTTPGVATVPGVVLR
ncbi:hypothetical protein Anapl_00114 [Anas platyrhynchos]|uniref:Uncharacterized protein n=1 Tax=Anas platyrhynchos TaxID=8839 RepID=R0LTY3_ANAPL|nr:hypothetical protein Anapl_00114 [Anas platyrhynchos]